MIIQAVNAIVCYVKDAEVSKQFYERVGFAVTEVSRGHIRIPLGSVELEFHDERLETIPEFLAEAGRSPKGAGLYLYFRVDKLEEHRQELLRKDISVSEIVERPWKNLECMVEDPDGYKLVLYRRNA